ncbi:hypothetical protein LAZ67_4003186 [Cordylochernes scorpioides]|uniref:HTH CENPB-type domain-containing protein n=1 Tax=Cordylochernes scorpioides TaxID=51811 RepID=A0ABY6KDF0_9ARAC|nr:hypothetical protein LAZ67_4003186 [Cordylochernes scorpioides]
MSSKRKHVVLSFTDKLKIVDQLKNSDAITNYASALDNEDGSLYRKAMKMAENKDLDAAVYTWFIQLHSQGQPISDPLICEKALEMNEKIGGNPDFKETTG